MLPFSLILLQAGSSGNPMISYVILGAMFLVFWLFIIRPQSKRQREQKQFNDSLQKGDEVVTASGILGRITKIEDNIITIEVATKVYLRVTRSAISKEMTESLYGGNQKPAPTGTAE
jgi:preprotein translocase subunit YajC